MSLFKKLFTEKMFFIVVGTCVCVLVVFFTLGIIEGVVIESNGETRWAAWRNRLEEVNQVLNKEKVVLYTDTVQGEMFGFKDLMVIPVLELTRDSTGEHRKMLNFQMYDAARGIQCLLFQEHRHIFDSRMVKVKDAVLWNQTRLSIFMTAESHITSPPIRIQDTGCFILFLKVIFSRMTSLIRMKLHLKSKNLL